MTEKRKGAGSFIVEWILRDKHGNVKDEGMAKEEMRNGNVSE